MLLRKKEEKENLLIIIKEKELNKNKLKIVNKI